MPFRPYNESLHSNFHPSRYNQALKGLIRVPLGHSIRKIVIAINPFYLADFPALIKLSQRH